MASSSKPGPDVDPLKHSLLRACAEFHGSASHCPKSGPTAQPRTCLCNQYSDDLLQAARSPTSTPKRNPESWLCRAGNRKISGFEPDIEKVCRDEPHTRRP